METGLCRQSIVLLRTTKQQPNNTQKHKIASHMTNKLATVKKKTQKNTHNEIKPKLTGPSSPVRTAHMSVHIIEYNCDTQQSTEQF